MRVLLVEDDETIAGFVDKGLREAGFAVDRVADGRSGLQKALAEPYDAAIVDVMLPQMDGLAVIDTLRAKGVRMPVLILSARRSVDDRVRGLQAGGDDYLTKPFAFAECSRASVAHPPRRAPSDRLSAVTPLDLLTRESSAARSRSSCARGVRAPRLPPRTPVASFENLELSHCGATIRSNTNVVDGCCRGCGASATSRFPRNSFTPCALRLLLRDKCHFAKGLMC